MEKEGESVAAAIRASKRELQAALPPDSEEPPWIMPHPEMPANEELDWLLVQLLQAYKVGVCLNIAVMPVVICQAWELLRVWDSAAIEKKDSRSIETEQQAEMDVDGAGTKVLLSLCLNLLSSALKLNI